MNALMMLIVGLALAISLNGTKGEQAAFSPLAPLPAASPTAHPADVYRLERTQARKQEKEALQALAAAGAALRAAPMQPGEARLLAGKERV